MNICLGRSVLLWTCAISTLAFSPLFAQSTAAARAAEPACADCTHRASPVAELGKGNADAPAFSLFTRISRDSRGRIIAGPVNDFSAVALYSADGKFERYIGGAGAGPGEFKSVAQSGIGIGDSLWVFDSNLRRLTVFTPDLKYARSMSFQPHQAISFAPTGYITGVADIRTENRIGRFLHQYNAATGSYIRSLGPEIAITPATVVKIPYVSVVGSKAGELWTAELEPIRLKLYGASAEVVRELRYQPTWLPFPRPAARTRPGRPATAELAATAPVPLEPVPTINAVTMGEDGDVWLLGAVPAPNWQRSPTPFEPPPAERKGVRNRVDSREKIDLMNKWYNTVVEAVHFDPSGRARTLVRAKLQTGVTQLLSNGYVAGMTADSDGIVSITIWKLQPK